MNKIKMLAYAALASISILSCRDALDITQDGEITESVAIQNTDDLKKFLIGNVYGSLNPTNEIALTSYFTDETAIATSNTGWYLGEFRYRLFKDNSYVASTWLTNYNTIDKVNRLLKLSQLVNPSAAELAQYNSVLAEGRALRALSYLNLLAYFSTDMKNPDALGVMLNTEVRDTASPLLPRVKNSEIFALIDQDLAFAEQNIMANESTQTNYKYATKALIYAIKARYYIYRGMANEAITEAQKAISLSPALANAPGTTLAQMPYRNMWTDAIQGEVIFALSRPQAGSWGNIASLWTTNNTSLTGAVQMGMSHKLYSLYGARDIRKVVFVDSSSDDDNKVIDKYPGKGSTPLRNDIKLFRTSEMHLILAEAYIMNNELALAAEEIKRVRDARHFGGYTVPLPQYANKKDAYEDLLLERRLEFCFEGHRYLDLKRLGQLAGVSIDRSPKDDYILSGTPLTLPITDHRFTYPIPQNEILGNPQMATQQNPGY